MKGYKLLSEKDKHFELQHPDGGAFKVAKSGLSNQHMAKIRKMAGGGEVDDDGTDQTTGQDFAPPPSNLDSLYSSQTADRPPSESINPEESANFASPEDLNQLATRLPKGPKEGEVAPPPSNNPNAAMEKDIGGMQQTSAPMSDSQSAFSSISADNEKAINNEMKAAQASAAAVQRAGDIQAKVYDDNAQRQQALQRETAVKYAALDKEQAQLKQDVMNTKIDPGKVWNNASTGNKVLAGIGVLLSGIGSGLTGQPNLAMSVINKTIDDDIAAQRSELGKKQSLLSDNYRKYGDLRQATLATELQLNAVVQGQVASAAAKTQGPIAQANAQHLMTEYTLKGNDIKRQLAVAQGFAQPSQVASGDVDMNRLKLGVATGAIKNEDHGKILDELGEYREMKQAQSDIKDAFKKVSDLQTLGNRIGNPVQSARQIDKIKKLYALKIAKDTANKVTESDTEYAMDQFANLTDDEKTRNVGMNNVLNVVSSKYKFPRMEFYNVYQPPVKAKENPNAIKSGLQLTSGTR